MAIPQQFLKTANGGLSGGECEVYLAWGIILWTLYTHLVPCNMSSVPSAPDRQDIASRSHVPCRFSTPIWVARFDKLHGILCEG
jgi:hypothetical protein